MKKVLNISIIILLMSSICIVGYLFINKDNIEKQKYNDKVVEFTVSLIKGEKSLNDIDTMTVSDEIKNEWISYYNNNFYDEKDTIILYENVKELDIILNEYLKDYNSCIVDGVFNREQFREIYVNKIYNAKEPLINGVEVFKYSDLYSNPILTEKDLSVIEDGIFEKDGNLVVEVGSITGYSDYITKYYKGIKLDIYHNALEKHIRDYRKKSDLYNSIKINSDFEEEGYICYVVRDDVNNSFDFKVKESFGKIVELYMTK